MSPRYESVPDAPQLAPRRTRPAPPPVTPSPAEDTTQMVPMTVAVHAELKRALKVACATSGITIQDAVAQALTAWLETKNQP